MLYGKLMALVVGVAVGAGAAGNHEAWKHGMKDTPLGKFISGQVGRFMVMRSELNLTDKQKEEFRDMLVSHRADIAKRIKPIHEKRTNLRNAVLADTPDEAAIRKAADELGKAIGDAAVDATKLVAKGKQILTSQQRERVKKFHKEFDTATEKFLDEVAGVK